MPKYQRLDLRVVELGLLPSRQAAQAAIMDGGIMVDGKKETKPGTQVKPNSTIALLQSWQPAKYVSRGGVKLDKALIDFKIEARDKICLDIGASTGGFTDCLLKHGAAMVYAIDVGYGQLDWRLRQDPKVVVKERVNARFLTPELIYTRDQSPAQLAVIDVSFISLNIILPACLKVLSPTKPEIVCLVKPQFEAGRASVSKGGVVRSKEVHENVIDSIRQKASLLGLKTAGITFSPLKGPAGNIEYLAYFTLGVQDIEIDVKATVETAHQVLNSNDTSKAINSLD